MRAVVTGATGFVGSHLCDALARQGQHVTCLVRPTSDLKWIADYPRIVVDSTDAAVLERALEGASHVFHCAGVVASPDRAGYRKGNWELTRGLVAAALRRSGRIERFLYVSSLAATGPARREAPVDESTPCRPVSEYGRTKLWAEREVLAAADRLAVTVLRPPVVYGPRDAGSGLRALYQVVRSGFAPRSGRRLFSVISVFDLVQAILRAAEAPQAKGETYFVADERIFEMDDLVHVIAGALKKTVRRVNIPPEAASSFLGGVATALGGLGVRTLLTRDKVREAVQTRWICTARKFERQFGPSAHAKLEEELARTVRWFESP